MRPHILACCIVAALLVGCSEEAADSEAADDTSSTETEQTSAEAPDPDEIPDSITAEEIEAGTTMLNEFRASAQTCGGTTYPATTALSWNRQLYDAAKRHSDDMAAEVFVGHTGSDDSSPFDRIEDAGYLYTGAAENVAGRMTRLATAFNGWVESSGHCTNMMRSVLVHYGMAVTNGYWTMVLAAPRS